MRTDLFDFDLPQERIALRPTEPRDAARLLVVHPDGKLEHRFFHELPGLLHKGDVLTFNDSKVIPARLSGFRPARLAGSPPVPIEVTLHRRLAADRFRAFVQPARRLKPGDEVHFGPFLSAQVAARHQGEAEFAFNQAGGALDQALARVGRMPLPPYIEKKRAPDLRDSADYQTVYARHDGSVAAPTAGLHFTPELLVRLAAAGISRADLTLHVGAGTFLPVEAEDTAEHVMHAETAALDEQNAALLNEVRKSGGRIGAVGTTALRTLESAADQTGDIASFHGETRIFITPGYRFRAADFLVTNFHLPRSTLFMLVAAFMGLETMRQAYAEAIREKYRFYSYGDACLLIRPP
ncbi:MAG TPA: tRNA preQ1(34) S-adenosylmethionine ribosyltransferase-isomerase QueA [Rhizomicrobium sp.]|nr:tRNA preQ1(34) S-adenosylmethionine ribosyltransferase-isomerase QueA [Rhizomicrobium sp.]